MEIKIKKKDYYDRHPDIIEPKINNANWQYSINNSEKKIPKKKRDYQ